MHSNIDDIVKSKINLKYKSKKTIPGKKKKHRRSATPAVGLNY